jgi:cation/acetate symporter
MTGNPIPQLGFGDTLVNSDVYLLDKLDKVTTELGFNAYTENTKSTIDIFCITAALMFGTAGLPHVIVRFFTVPRVSDARKSAGYALIFIAILYSTAPAVSAFARMNFIDSVQEVQYKEAPSWFKNWENIGLIAWKDKNNDELIQYSSGNALDGVKPNFKKGRGLSGERLVNNSSDLSTAAGLLLVISASISHDLLKKTFMPQITEKQELFYARCSAAVAIFIAGLFGIYPPGFVAQVVAFAFGLAAATIFPVLLMGIFYKRLNKEGAIAGMLSGLVITSAYIIYYKFININLNSADNWFLGISPEGFGFVGMIINFVVALIVSFFFSKPPSDIYRMVDNIRQP